MKLAVSDSKKVVQKWYYRRVQEYVRKDVCTIFAVISVQLAMAVWQLMQGSVFEWRNIQPIGQPDIFIRLLYSALTFGSLGAILYALRFYQFLSWIFGRDRKGYRDAKGKIWVGLILAMYFVVVPVVVDVMNAVVSFFYNVTLLALYVSPILFIISLTAVVLTACLKAYKQKFTEWFSQPE